MITNRSTVKSCRQEKNEPRWEGGDTGRMQRNGRHPSLKGKGALDQMKLHGILESLLF